MGTGRKKIEMKKIENISRRRVAFSKRKEGLFKKAAALSHLTGCRVAVLTFSCGVMKPFSYGNLALLDEALAAFGNLNGGKLNPNLSASVVDDDLGMDLECGTGVDDKDLFFTEDELADDEIVRYSLGFSEVADGGKDLPFTEDELAKMMAADDNDLCFTEGDLAELMTDDENTVGVGDDLPNSLGCSEAADGKVLSFTEDELEEPTADAVAAADDLTNYLGCGEFANGKDLGFTEDELAERMSNAEDNADIAMADDLPNSVGCGEVADGKDLCFPDDELTELMVNNEKTVDAAADNASCSMNASSSDTMATGCNDANYNNDIAFQMVPCSSSARIENYYFAANYTNTYVMNEEMMMQLASSSNIAGSVDEQEDMGQLLLRKWRLETVREEMSFDYRMACEAGGMQPLFNF